MNALGLALSLVLGVAAVAYASPLWVEPPPVPLLEPPEPPAVEAEAWLLFDEGNEVTLAEHNADTPLPMASTTKLMTALLAVEMGDLSSPVQVSRRAAEMAGSNVFLTEGEVFLLRTLVRALLIRSGNDAATAVAEHLGGSMEEFVVLMNERAGELGLENTSYANPHGLDHPDQYSSARDLLTLTREVMKHEELAEAVGTAQISLRDTPAGDQRVYSNTNDLLSEYEGMFGVKTGFTSGAGRVLVAGAERGERRLLSVVMKTQQSFSDTRALLDYGFLSFGSIPGLVSSQLRLTRDQVLAVSPPPTTSSSTTLVSEVVEEQVETEPVSVEPVEPDAPVAVRAGDTPDGVFDLLSWMLRLFSYGNGGR